jgi:hypothetical protein
MPTLDRIQRWMQTVIMSPGGIDSGVASAEARSLIDVGLEDFEKVIRRSRALTGLERLDIYHRAYFSRLVECLREEYPILCRALGDEAFDEFAIDYLQTYPSRSYTLNDLGTNFPRFLADTRPAEEAGAESGGSWADFLIDLATLELTYNEVFDGPGVEGQSLLDADVLRAIPADRWPEARLVPVSCLRLLRLRFPVHRYYAASRAGKGAAIPRPRATYLAVTRKSYVVRRYPLYGPQYTLLDALVGGQPIGEAIRRLTAASGGRRGDLTGRLWQWFHNWTAEGFFTAVSFGQGDACSPPVPV